MVGALFSRCGEGWLWVSRGSSGLRGDPPSVAPSEAQRAGHLKMPLRVPILEALRKIGAMAYALRHADHRISQVTIIITIMSAMTSRIRMDGAEGYSAAASTSGVL